MSKQASRHQGIYMTAIQAWMARLLPLKLQLCPSSEKSQSRQFKDPRHIA